MIRVRSKSERRILLVVGGGVAAFKALQLIRLLSDEGIAAPSVVTDAGQAFVTPLSVGALSGEPVHTDLLSLTAEQTMGHIELSRSADLIVVAPATADLMAKMANGLANDLASTVLLATDKPVLIAPAMNVRMWMHPSTQRNLQTLRADGVQIIGPTEGAMACGEHGPGRMAEPEDILAAILSALHGDDKPLSGRRALVTSGPTHEPIDPVRYIANRSSGRQGVAIAEALATLGAEVVFVTGPAEEKSPRGVSRIVEVETARQMRDAALSALSDRDAGAGPFDIGVFAAAVADWRVASAAETKVKKAKGENAPSFALVENPDILKEVSASAENLRPSLVIGFAAETDNVEANAQAKRARKGCDWLVANDVSAASGIMGGAENEILLITSDGGERWPRAAKTAVARLLADRVAEHFNKSEKP